MARLDFKDQTDITDITVHMNYPKLRGTKEVNVQHGNPW